VRIEIAEVSEDVKRLKKLCMEKGLMDADGHPTQDSSVGGESTAVSRQGAQPEQPAEHSKLSQYQEPPWNNELDSSFSVHNESFGPFINIWLLHKLRSSSMEVLLFACYVAGRVDNMDGLKWQAEALRLWEQDGAERNAPENVERLESYVISSIHRSFDKVPVWDGGKQYSGARKDSPLKSTVNRISLPIKFRSRLRAKSVF